MSRDWFEPYLDKLLSWLSKTWLIGGLFRAGRKVFAESLYEFLYLFIWSILPFALGALVLYVTTESPTKSFYEFGRDTFKNGELLVFTISMLAPILYLTLHEPDQADAFPHKLPISTTVALIIVVCAALFALLKANSVKDITFVLNFSVVLTVLALIFRYLALVYHRLRLPQPTERELRSSQTSFVDEFRRHVGDEAPSAAAFTQSVANQVGEAK